MDYHHCHPKWEMADTLFFFRVKVSECVRAYHISGFFMCAAGGQKMPGRYLAAAE